MSPEALQKNCYADQESSDSLSSVSKHASVNHTVAVRWLLLNREYHPRAEPPRQILIANSLAAQQWAYFQVAFQDTCF